MTHPTVYGTDPFKCVKPVGDCVLDREEVVDIVRWLQDMEALPVVAPRPAVRSPTRLQVHIFRMHIHVQRCARDFISPLTFFTTKSRFPLWEIYSMMLSCWR